MHLYRPLTQTVMAAMWNGTNSVEIRELLGGLPFPHLGHWVVVKGSSVVILSPAEFASTYEPIL